MPPLTWPKRSRRAAALWSHLVARDERLVAVAGAVVEEHVNEHARVGVVHVEVVPDRLVVVGAQTEPATASKPWSAKVTWVENPSLCPSWSVGRSVRR